MDKIHGQSAMLLAFVNMPLSIFVHFGPLIQFIGLFASLVKNRQFLYDYPH